MRGGHVQHVWSAEKMRGGQSQFVPHRRRTCRAQTEALRTQQDKRGLTGPGGCSDQAEQQQAQLLIAHVLTGRGHG